MHIVVRHDEAGQWWWAAVADDGRPTAVSALYGSRSDCMRALVELKVEGPVAPVTTEEVAVPAPPLGHNGLHA